MVRRTKWKLPNSPSCDSKSDAILHPGKNHRDQCHHERLNGVSLCNPTLWLIQKSNRSWQMKVSYHKWNQAVAPISAAMWLFTEKISFLSSICIWLLMCQMNYSGYLLVRMVKSGLLLHGKDNCQLGRDSHNWVPSRIGGGTSGKGYLPTRL